MSVPNEDLTRVGAGGDVVARGGKGGAGEVGANGEERGRKGGDEFVGGSIEAANGVVSGRGEEARTVEGEEDAGDGVGVRGDEAGGDGISFGVKNNHILIHMSSIHR